MRVLQTCQDRLVAYSTQDATGSTQVFVTNFDNIPVTLQLTSVGNSNFPDISGNRVTYQSFRSGAQNIYVFDLTTVSETASTCPEVSATPTLVVTGCHLRIIRRPPA